MAVSLGAAIFFVACSTTMGDMERVGRYPSDIENWALARGFVVLSTGEDSPFDVVVLARDIDHVLATEEVSVYIEGDGAPWLSAYQPPPDPTPLRPLALGLAAQQGAGPVLYFARPCQYRTSSTCDAQWWTSHRFAPEVLQFYQRQLDRIKGHNHIHTWRLIGHSGGGVLAMALASQRDDVRQVVTIASPVDVQAWVDWHDLQTMLVPPIALRLGTEALYLGGARDMIVPPSLIESGWRRFHGQQRIFPDFDHECCWRTVWPEVLKGLSERRK